MSYVNLSYNYIAIFFLFMLLYWYIMEKKVPLRSYRYFAYVLVTAFGATLLEIITYKMALHENRFSFPMTYTILSIQMLFIHSLFTCLTNYLLGLAEVDIKRNRKLRAVFVISWILIAVICGLNPVFEWAATLVGNVYAIKGIGFLLYGIDAVMVFLMAWVLIARRQKFRFIKKSIAIFLFVCAVAAGIAQELNATPMLNLAISLFCLVFYLFGQGPEVDIDKTTGIFNRTFFGKYLKDRFVSAEPFSLIVLDLDDFRFINQNYGMLIGDVLLQQVGAYLEGLHQVNTVFRYGADQFAAVIDKDVAIAYDTAEEILKRFGNPWEHEQLEIMMSATLCVIECPQDADNREKLLEIIDYTMETAKSFGKGKITFASEIDLEKSKSFKNVEKAVKEAIAEERVRVYYQPIFSLKKRRYNCAEALARLYDPKLGWIPPDVFITVAEKTGLIIELGEIILHNVCRFIKENNLAETGIEYIDINVSPLQLMQKGFAYKMLDIMKQYGVDASQINVEITETAMMTSFAVVNENIMELVENNIALSLDDYGSGYANINYLISMPFKFIKLDKDLVQASFEDEKARITLEHTIKMLNALDLSIIAEGVETEEMRNELKKFGCHYLQGWYYSKAVAEDAFLEKI